MRHSPWDGRTDGRRNGRTRLANKQASKQAGRRAGRQAGNRHALTKKRLVDSQSIMGSTMARKWLCRRGNKDGPEQGRCRRRKSRRESFPSSKPERMSSSSFNCGDNCANDLHIPIRKLGFFCSFASRRCPVLAPHLNSAQTWTEMTRISQILLQKLVLHIFDFSPSDSVLFPLSSSHSGQARSLKEEE